MELINSRIATITAWKLCLKRWLNGKFKSKYEKMSAFLIKDADFFGVILI